MVRDIVHTILMEFFEEVSGIIFFTLCKTRLLLPPRPCPPFTSPCGAEGVRARAPHASAPLLLITGLISQTAGWPCVACLPQSLILMHLISMGWAGLDCAVLLAGGLVNWKGP